MTIEIEHDFNGYFEKLSRRIVKIAEKTGRELWCNKVVVDAAPYRSIALDVSIVDERTVRFEFYSALRSGFGKLSTEDLVRAAALLEKDHVCGLLLKKGTVQ